MRPTFDQIRTAAYERWQRRGGAHGSDRADWLAAERRLRFTANYRLAAAHRLDPESPRTIGATALARCRFCGHATSRTDLTAGTPIFPEALGPGGPVAFDQCDECASLFAEAIDPGLSRFLLAVPSAGLPGIGVDAFKGLVKLALAIMPATDLDDHEETVEWVSNPDHDFDLNVFRELTCAVHRYPSPFPAPWAAVARLTDEDEAWPAMLLFLGAGHVALQVPAPLGQRDEEHDGATATVPDLLPPSPFGPEDEPISRVLLPLIGTGGVRGALLAATGRRSD